MRDYSFSRFQRNCFPSNRCVITSEGNIEVFVSVAGKATAATHLPRGRRGSEPQSAAAN